MSPATRRSVVERLELAATVLLALATVGTAWSGYQASRWGAEQARALAKASALRIESAKADGLANAQSQVDVAVFTQWTDAYARGEKELADFYRTRFRPEFKPAFTAWVATRPLKNPAAPLTPFAMPQYKLAAREQAERLDAEAGVVAARGLASVESATNYVLCAVLFAAALFFAGVSTRLDSARARRLLLGIGLAVFVGTAVRLATLPVSFSV